MRALAVLLVVAFHAGLPGVSGGFVGVDVFFVISGFLITGLLVDEVRTSGTIDLPAFWARRIRRLLPLATIVLVSTSVAFRFVLAPLDREGLGDSVVSSALWTANWHFAADQTNYMSDSAHSPVLHYWSLSVEEQYYLLWPLLLLGLVWVSRRVESPVGLVQGEYGSRALAIARDWNRSCPLRWFAMALAVVAALSLLLSVLLTDSTGPWAYYGLHTRAWELAAGGSLALARPLADFLPRAWAVIAGWMGLVLVCGSALTINRTTPFPGTAAIWPVLGACLLVAAGARCRSGASFLLARALPTFVGRISYGWYLWHWPCLQLAHHLTMPASPDPEEPVVSGPGLWPTALAVLGSLGLAVLTHHLVEQPVRHWTWLIALPRRTLAVGACLLLVATSVPSLLLVSTTAPSTAAVGPPPAQETDAGLPDTQQSPGDQLPTAQDPSVGSTSPEDRAAQDPTTSRAALRQSPQQARDDQQTPHRCFVTFQVPTADPRCRFGDPAGKRIMVLFGDSHAAHWFPALNEVARRSHWQLWVWTKSGCGYADTAQWLSTFRREYGECAQWREEALRHIEALDRVDAVVVTRSKNQLGKLVDQDGEVVSKDEGRQQELWAAGVEKVMSRLKARASSVVLIRDVPRPPQDIPACISKHLSDPGQCDFPAQGNTDGDSEVFSAEIASVRAHGVQVMGTNDLICHDGRCPAVSAQGNITYRDNHHLTASFSLEMSKAFGQRLMPLIRKNP